MRKVLTSTQFNQTLGMLTRDVSPTSQEFNKISYDQIFDPYDMTDFLQQNVFPFIYKTETLAE